MGTVRSLPTGAGGGLMGAALTGFASGLDGAAGLGTSFCGGTAGAADGGGAAKVQSFQWKRNTEPSRMRHHQNHQHCGT